MRYITNADSYLVTVSFGGDVECEHGVCMEYEGSVPTGYTSLEAWYAEESEKLYRWKVVNGQLTVDTGAVEPVPPDIVVSTPTVCVRGSEALSLSTSAQQVMLGTAVYNDSALFSLSDGGVRCERSGMILVMGTVYLDSMTAGHDIGVMVYKNGAQNLATRTGVSQATISAHIPMRAMKVLAGDVISVYAVNYTAEAGRVVGSGNTNMTIMYLQ